jgi:hypothetical protein
MHKASHDGELKSKDDVKNIRTCVPPLEDTAKHFSTKKMEMNDAE